MSYDPTIGRWLNEDPIGFEAGDANKYRYVGNKVTTFIDPDGLEEQSIQLNPVDVTDADLDDEIVELHLSGVLPLGVEMLETGQLRLQYEQTAKFISECDLTDAEKKAAREALKQQMRARQTNLGKAITERLLREREKAGFQSSKNNPGKTNARINAQAKIFRVGGRLLIVISIASEAHAIATADEPLQELPRAAGRVEGGLMGGMAGSCYGAQFGPAGVVVGTLAGGSLGAIVGEEVIDAYMISTMDVLKRQEEIYFYGHPGGARP